MMKQETETLRTAAEILSSSRVVASIIDSGGPYGDGLKDLNTLITALDLWCEEYGLSWSKDLSGTVSIQTANGAIICYSRRASSAHKTGLHSNYQTQNLIHGGVCSSIFTTPHWPTWNGMVG